MSSNPHPTPNPAPMHRRGAAALTALADRLVAFCAGLHAANGLAHGVSPEAESAARHRMSMR